MNQTQFEAAIKEATGAATIHMNWARQRAQLEDIAEILKKVFPSHFETLSCTNDVTVVFKMKTIEDVTPVLRYITAVSGLHQFGEAKKDGTIWTWQFKNPNAMYSYLSVTVFFEGKCRMVKVGEKREEVVTPIMEMVCGDEEPVAEGEAAPDVPAAESDDFTDEDY